MSHQGNPGENGYLNIGRDCRQRRSHQKQESEQGHTYQRDPYGKFKGQACSVAVNDGEVGVVIAQCLAYNRHANICEENERKKKVRK